MTMMTMKTWMTRACKGSDDGAGWWPAPDPGGPAKNQLDLHPPVTRIATEVQSLHYFMLVICVVIFVAVFGVMFYSIIKHRKSVGHKRRQLPRERGGRDRLDRRAVHHRRRDGR
jgi:hypothetical protein